MNEQLFHTIDHASVAQITAHLQACDATFVPPLSKRVTLAEYAAKMHTHARRFEWWHGEVLVAFAAMYVNQPPIAYLSNISVLPAFARRGLATRLLQQCVATAQAQGLDVLSLQVAADNRAAYALYAQHGFRLAVQDAGICRLEKPL